MRRWIGAGALSVTGLAAFLAAYLGSEPAASPRLLAYEPLSAPSPVEKATLRRPTAIVLLDDGKLLATANRQSGTISLIDPRQQRVVDEVAVGKSLADLQATSDGRYLLAVD